MINSLTLHPSKVHWPQRRPAICQWEAAKDADQKGGTNKSQGEGGERGEGPLKRRGGYIWRFPAPTI